MILVGVTLLPTVADKVAEAQDDGSGSSNITGASATIVDLVTLFFALGIMSAGVAIAAQGLRAAGMLT